MVPDVGGDLAGVLPGLQIVRDLAVPPVVDAEVLGQVEPGAQGALPCRHLLGFAVLAVSAEVEREGIREMTLEGLDAAARKGNHGGRPTVVGDDKLAVARARHGQGESVTAIAKALGSRVPPPLYRHIAESA